MSRKDLLLRMMASVRMGDTASLWELWKEIERQGFPRYRIGSLPHLGAVQGELLELAGFHRSNLLAEHGTELIQVQDLEDTLGVNREDWFWVDGDDLVDDDQIGMQLNEDTGQFHPYFILDSTNTEIPEEIYPTSFEPEQLGIDDTIEVRLQYLPETEDWNLHFGDPGFDTDHRGLWASGNLPAWITEFETEAFGKELIAEIWDQLLQEEDRGTPALPPELS